VGSHVTSGVATQRFLDNTPEAHSGELPTHSDGSTVPRYSLLLERITTDAEKLRAVRELPTPKKKHEIRSFLSQCMYYRRSTSGFANVAKPLTKLTEEKQAFQWTPEVEAVFQTLKEALCTAPILAYPQPRKVRC
jgi:hypothetical protein